MATEPVGRSRIRSDEVVVPGRAIPRMCHGEEDEEWLAQRDHLVEECERAIDLFVKRWDALQRHANWDRRQGHQGDLESGSALSRTQDSFSRPDHTITR